MESMDDSTPMSKQLEEEARRAAATANSATDGGASQSAAVSAAGAASSATSMSNLLQPSSFSSSLSAHPFMSQHNARSPHGARPATASAFSNAAAPAFSLASGSAAAPAAAASSLHVPAFGAASASPGPRSPGPAGSKKRSSEQFYEQHQTDRDSLPTLQAKHARADSDDDLEAGRGRSALSPGDMDEEGEEGTRNGRDKDAKATFAPVDEDEDSSFMSLLNKLAHLEFPNRSPSTREQCPCCPELFPLEEFAAHVYKCIQKLDVDERKEQERLDAKLATQIAFGGGDYGRPSGRRRGLMLHGGRVSPEAVEEEEEHLLEKFASNKQEVCKAGSQCDRVDAQHFVLKWHPEVECPLCSEKFPVYEVNAHVTMCLDRPASARPPKADASMTDGAAPQSSPPPAGSSSAASASSAFPAGVFSSAAIAIPSSSAVSGMPRRPRKMGQRSVSATVMGSNSQLSDEDDLGSPPLGLGNDDDDADDEADDDDKPAPSRPAATAAAAAAASSSSASALPASSLEDDKPILHRSNSDCSLSLAQAAAVASLVLKRKAAPKAVGEKDPSLLELLNTFSSLGFNRENLEALHAKHQQQENDSKDNEQK